MSAEHRDLVLVSLERAATDLIESLGEARRVVNDDDYAYQNVLAYAETLVKVGQRAAAFLSLMGEARYCQRFILAERKARELGGE